MKVLWRDDISEYHGCPNGGSGRVDAADIADSEIAVAFSLPDRAAQSAELWRIPEHPWAVAALEGLIRAHLGRSTSAYTFATFKHAYPFKKKKERGC
jgi:hypothetical protein